MEHDNRGVLERKLRAPNDWSPLRHGRRVTCPTLRTTSLVVVQRSEAELPPLLRIMAVDRKGNGFGGNDVSELPRAPACLGFVLIIGIDRPRVGVCSRRGGYRIDRKQHRSRLGQVHQNGLVTRYMSTGFDEVHALTQCRVAVDEPVLEIRYIPVLSDGGKAGVICLRCQVMAPLHDQFGRPEKVVVACVVGVEVSTDEHVDVAWLEAHGTEALGHMILGPDEWPKLEGALRPRRLIDEAPGEPGVDKDVLTVPGLDEVSWDWNAEGTQFAEAEE